MLSYMNRFSRYDKIQLIKMKRRLAHHSTVDILLQGHAICAQKCRCYIHNMYHKEMEIYVENILVKSNCKLDPEHMNES